MVAILDNGKNRFGREKIRVSLAIDPGGFKDEAGMVPFKRSRKMMLNGPRATLGQIKPRWYHPQLQEFNWSQCQLRTSPPTEEHTKGENTVKNLRYLKVLRGE